MNTQTNRLFQKVQIGLASPKMIRNWAERYSPVGGTVGEVTSWETVNYKTLKPEPDGLFCQKIFGPVVDFTCACGKKKKALNYKVRYCQKCGVERTQSRVRRYRLGYIKLKQPVVHPLYASQRPSPLALCLNWTSRRTQVVMLTAEFCSLPEHFTCFIPRLQTGRIYEDYEREKQKRLDSLFPQNFNTPKTEFRFLEKADMSTQTPVSFSSREQTNSLLSSTKRCFSKTKPPLFRSGKKENKARDLLFNMGTGEPRLYGLAYDATWRQVEDFQEVLFYMWEQSFSYEPSIAYYALALPFPREVEKKDIPYHPQSYGIQTGGFVFQHILSDIDKNKIQFELKRHYKRLNYRIRLILRRVAELNLAEYEDRKEYKKLRIKLNRFRTKRLKCKRQLTLFRDFQRSQMQPAWMALSYLPVLPPGLRPITSIRGELIVSDINSLYRKVLIRNNRIHQGVNFGVFDTVLSGSWLSWCYNLRQVQQAVDELFKTGSTESGGRHLKSLLETLKGKQGRFRQHLLGKRVDYSGRSVIVVGPELQLHQCGLPKQMALELFQPFIIQKLRKHKIVVTITAAKAFIAERKPIIWAILAEILKTHPVLLNRAPTLHRLGIQAFLPKLVEGKAILLHPLVCPAFNADFDGDQMAVHVPLSPKTQAEAFNLLWARNHLLAPATGQPLLVPTQDMVLGFYYLTCSLEKMENEGESLVSTRQVLLENKTQNQFGSQPPPPKNSMLLSTKKGFLWKGCEGTVSPFNWSFSDFTQVKTAYDRGLVDLHTPIWVKWSGFVQTTESVTQAQDQNTLLETRLDIFGRGESIFLETSQRWKEAESLQFSTPKSQFVRTTPGRVLMHSWLFKAREKDLAKS